MKTAAIKFTPAEVADLVRKASVNALSTILDCLDELPEHITAREAVAAIRSDDGVAEFSARMTAEFDQWAARTERGEW